MICAVIDQAGNVVNTIVADPSAPAPSGCSLVAVPDGWPVSIAWTWTEAESFKTPEGVVYQNPEPEPEPSGGG